jgi:uncharacterized protein HemX
MDKTMLPAGFAAASYAAGILTGALGASVYFLTRHQQQQQQQQQQQLQGQGVMESSLHSKELEDLEKQFHIPPLKLQQLLYKTSFLSFKKTPGAHHPPP